MGRYFAIQQKLQLSNSSPTCLQPALLYRFTCRTAELLYELWFPTTTENRICITTSASGLIINLCNEHQFCPYQQYRERADIRKKIETGLSLSCGGFLPLTKAHHSHSNIKITTIKHSRRLILTGAAAL